MYQSLPLNSVVVQKYGGTSVGSIERIRAVAERTRVIRAQGWNRIALVLSAMSGETNRLVSLVREINPEASRKAYDMAVAAGEQVSIGLASAALDAVGVPSEPLLAHQVGIHTDALHGRAKITSIRTEAIQRAWDAGRVPVIAGFQGVTADGALTTLGRGGSDTSAVALAVALNAALCEINTDVDGIYTADPRYVQGARLVREMDYETALELAASGGKVLHSRCVELGAKFRMPIVVRNSFSKDEQRSTLVTVFNEAQTLESPVVSAITVDENVARVTVKGIPVNGKVLATMFTKIAALGANVDIIVHNRQPDETTDRFGFTLPKEDLPAALNALEALRSETRYEDMVTRVSDDLAKVSAVGLGMKSHAGVASRVFQTLFDEGIEAHMISTSEIKISCVVPRDQARAAAQALHRAFFGE